MKSVWSESCKFRKREALNKDIKTDVLVIGAGIAGVLTAYMLKQKGREVVVIDATEIASGNTKNTTAKITSQHDLIYSKLIAEFGEEKARQYAKANELAIKKYKEIIEDKRILELMLNLLMRQIYLLRLMELLNLIIKHNLIHLNF